MRAETAMVVKATILTDYLWFLLVVLKGGSDWLVGRLVGLLGINDCKARKSENKKRNRR